MRFREAVFPEALNLIVDPVGEVFVVATGLHPGEQLLTKRLHHAPSPPRPHRAAELIGLTRREARRDDGGMAAFSSGVSSSSRPRVMTLPPTC